jgi:hypothetical protein
LKSHRREKGAEAESVKLRIRNNRSDHNKERGEVNEMKILLLTAIYESYSLSLNMICKCTAYVVSLPESRLTPRTKPLLNTLGNGNEMNNCFRNASCAGVSF